jgi:hypothetical protein
MTEPLLDAAGRRRSPATMRGFPRRPPAAQQRHPLPRGSADRRGDRRRDAHGGRRPAWSSPPRPGGSCCGARGCASTSPGAQRVRSGPPARLTARAPRQGRPPPRGRHGRVGVGTACPVERRASRAPGGAAVLRHQRSDARATVVSRRRAHPAAAHRSGRRRASTLRAPSATPRARGRDGPRGRPADRHPATARPPQPGITSIYLQGIDNAEIIDTVHARRAPMVPVSASLRL